MLLQCMTDPNFQLHDTTIQHNRGFMVYGRRSVTSLYFGRKCDSTMNSESAERYYNLQNNTEVDGWNYSLVSVLYIHTHMCN